VTWYVYLARCSDGSLYTGVAKDVAKRLAQHDAGKGAKYTRGRGPLELCAQAACEEKGEALKMEKRIKALSRTEKLRLAKLGALPVLPALVSLVLVALALAGCDTPAPAISPPDAAGSTMSFADLAKIDAGLTLTAADAGPAKPSGPPRTTTDCVAKDGTVDFHGDKLLEADVRKKLQKLEGPIHERELKTIKSINISGGTVDSLDPCIFPRLTAMRDLFVGPGAVEDLSPLATLVQMRSLRVSVSHVADLTPLDKLGYMDRIDLGRTPVHDVTTLGHLQNLTEIQLDDTLVTDIGPLSSCTKLQKVSLQRTGVSDLTPLRGALGLKFLYIQGTQVHDLTPLSSQVGHGLRIIQN
jgi:predicted GIY-YIG superfamily endonuclease